MVKKKKIVEKVVNINLLVDLRCLCCDKKIKKLYCKKCWTIKKKILVITNTNAVWYCCPDCRVILHYTYRYDEQLLAIKEFNSKDGVAYKKLKDGKFGVMGAADIERWIVAHWFTKEDDVGKVKKLYRQIAFDCEVILQMMRRIRKERKKGKKEDIILKEMKKEFGRRLRQRAKRG